MVMSRDPAANSESFYLSPNSVLTFRKSYQIRGKWLKNKKVTGKNNVGVENISHQNVYRVKDRPLFFIGVLPFLGLADNFFLKSNAFQTIFLITFCYESNFLQPFLKTLQAFLKILFEKNTSCACIHMKD